MRTEKIKVGFGLRDVVGRKCIACAHALSRHIGEVDIHDKKHFKITCKVCKSRICALD